MNERAELLAKLLSERHGVTLPEAIARQSISDHVDLVADLMRVGRQAAKYYVTEDSAPLRSPRMGGCRIAATLMAAAALTACAPPLPLPSSTTVTTVVERELAPTTSARMDNATLSELVRGAVQTQIMKEPTLADHYLQVQRVTVVNEVGNNYRGVAYVKPPMGEAQPVGVLVMYDGSDLLMKFENPDEDFAFVRNLPTR